MIKKTVTCDECYAVKKDANHWFLANHSFSSLEVDRWEGDRAEMKGMKHICGLECLGKLMQRWAARTQ